MSTPEGPPTPPQPPTPPSPQAPVVAQPETAAMVPNPSGPPQPGYPVQLNVTYPQQLSRWLPFVKWILAIPHFFALVAVGIVAYFMAIYAFFSVLFTGKYPRSAFDFITGVFRWGVRVGAYVYLLTDAYPPFSLQDDPSYPVRLTIEYPERIANWRPLVAWLLCIPALAGAAVLGWVAGIVEFIAWFAIVFTRRFPSGMFELVVAALRWQARANAYAYYMTEQYPPFVYG